MQTKVIIRQPRKGKENEDIMWTLKKKASDLKTFRTVRDGLLGR